MVHPVPSLEALERIQSDRVELLVCSAALECLLIDHMCALQAMSRIYLRFGLSRAPVIWCINLPEKDAALLDLDVEFLELALVGLQVASL